MKINCCQLQRVSWEDPRRPHLQANEVHVWRACISNHVSASSFFIDLLDEFEKNRMNRYFRYVDKQGFLVRRGILRILLAEYLNRLPGEIRISQEKNKKPAIGDAAVNLHFNLSYSNAYVVVAIADSPVGIDIERVDLAFDYHDIIHQHFSIREKEYVRQSDRPPYKFYELWTRKEAILKAIAKGITDDLKAASCLPGLNVLNQYIFASANDWLVESFELTKDYLVSLAHVENTKIRFYDFDTFPYLPENNLTNVDTYP